jgi:hypothetical protein
MVFEEGWVIRRIGRLFVGGWGWVGRVESGTVLGAPGTVPSMHVKEE